MSFIDIFTWFVLAVMVLSIVAIFVFLGMWPIMVAKKRNHPQLAAIQVGSWVTLILGMALWPVILIWAHANRPLVKIIDASNELADENLQQKVSDLESRLARIEEQKAGAA